MHLNTCTLTSDPEASTPPSGVQETSTALRVIEYGCHGKAHPVYIPVDAYGEAGEP